MPLLAALVLQVEAAAFAPPLGVPIRVVTERSQGEGSSRFTVHVERLVRFARDGIGYRAEVLLVAASATPRADAAAMLQAGFAGLAGRTIVVRLDGAGKVASVDDLPALWEAFCSAIAAEVAAKHGNAADRAAVAESMTGALRGLPAVRRQAVIGSLVSALVADGDTTPGTRPIRLPGASPFGGKAELTGTRTVAAGHIVTRAAADVPGQDGASAHIELETDEAVDPATGLVVSQSETLRTTTGERTTERISTVRVTPEPSARWPG